MQNIKKEKYKAIAYIGIILVLLNGSFLAYCNGYDPTLELIQKFGNWINAGLWQSSKIFVTYAVADAAWNVQYVAPRILRSFFIVKWADKLNSYFGFSTKGELEEHIARQIYSPLYRDTMNGVYYNLGLPLYNLTASILGVKAKKVLDTKVQEPIIFEITKEVTREINKVQIVEKHNQDLLRLEKEIKKAYKSLDNFALVQTQNATTSDLLKEVFALRNFEEAVTYPVYKLKRTFAKYNMPLSDEERGAESLPQRLSSLEIREDFITVVFKDTKYSVTLSFSDFAKDYPLLSRAFSQAFDTPCAHYYSAVFGDRPVGGNFVSLNQGLPEGAEIITKDSPIWIRIRISYETISEGNWLRPPRYEILPNNSSISIRFNYDGRERELVDLGGALIDKLKLILTGTAQRHNTEFNTHLAKIEALLENSCQKENPQDIDPSATGYLSDLEEEAFTNIVDGSVASETVQWVPAASIGALSTLTLGQALIVFSYFFGIDTFNTMLQQNTHVQEALIHMYTSNGLDIPAIISDIINNDANFNNNTATINLQNSNISSTPTSPNGGIPFYNYVFYGFLIAGITGVTWYLVKTGLDTNSAVETAKTYEETLRSRYTNF